MSFSLRPLNIQSLPIPLLPHDACMIKPTNLSKYKNHHFLLLQTKNLNRLFMDNMDRRLGVHPSQTHTSFSYISVTSHSASVVHFPDKKANTFHPFVSLLLSLASSILLSCLRACSACSCPSRYQTATPAQDTFLSSTSKSSTMSLVSSVPLRLPTAHTSLVLLQRSRHTTPPLPPLSSDTRFRRNSPVFRSQILTVPSSEEVMTNFLLNCRHVTALWCLLGPETRRATHGGREEKVGGILQVTKFTAMLGHQ